MYKTDNDTGKMTLCIYRVAMAIKHTMTKTAISQKWLSFFTKVFTIIQFGCPHLSHKYYNIITRKE